MKSKRSGKKKVIAFPASREMSEREVIEAAAVDQMEVICRYAPDGRVTWVNAVFCRLFGKTEEDLVGREWTPLVYEADLDLVKKRVAQLSVDHPTVIIENRVHTAGGEVRWMHFVNRGFFNDAGVLLEVQCVGRDITERKQAEEELRESKERWQFAVESSGYGVWDWHVPSGVVSFSKRWREMIGYDEDELGDKFQEWYERLHPDDVEMVMQRVSDAIEGRVKTYENEFRMRTKAGAYRWILARGRIISFTADGKPLRFVGTHTDVTEQRLARERKANDLRMVAEGAPLESVLLAIAESVEAEYPLLKCCVMLLMESRDCLQPVAAPRLRRSFLRVIAGVKVSADVMCSPAAVATRERVVCEAISTHPNWEGYRDAALKEGLRACWSEPIMDSSQRALGAIACYWPVPFVPDAGKLEAVEAAAHLMGLAVERQRREQELSRSEQRFRAIFEQAAVGVVILDTVVNRFLEVNQQMCEISGYSSAELLERGLGDLCCQPDAVQVAKRIKAQVKKRAASARFECCIQHKAGHPVWVNVALSPLWAEAVGERCHYVMVVEDVTAMKRTGEAYKNEVLYNEAVIEHTSAFIVAVDREGRFMSLNGAFLTMMGYKKSEVLGKTPWELGMMDEKETVRSQARFAALLEGSPPPPVEVKLRDRWGGLHDVELRSALIPGGVGGVDRIVVTGTDFTERNRLQQDILEIVETEQARLGHDLHDGVGQTMTGVVALMNALEADLSGRQKEDARRIRELLQQSVMEVRRMSHGLSPTSIAYRGLHGGLELLAEMVRTNFRTECVTELDASIRVEDQKKQANLYRICQEALNNAIRHGDPQTVWVRLRRLEEGGGRCVLEVVDDGRGILVSKRAKPSGIGLRVMEYRAGLIGARFSLKSRRGKGVTVSCEFTEDAVGSGG